MTRTHRSAPSQPPGALPTEADPRWRAVVARDPAADGTFYYSVQTTGVYCIPSCAARLARPAHVRLHDTRGNAEQAGFRACRRCKPDQEISMPRPRSEAITFAIAPCSLGLVLVARTDHGLSAVLLGADRESLRRELRDRFPGATLAEDDADLAPLVAAVRAFVDVPTSELDVPLDLRGTEFQRSVWRALREIPAGSTATYTEIATRIGRPSAVRAVASACAANALAVVVPCHRVLRSDGALSGYRWGVERKRALLDRESLS